MRDEDGRSELAAPVNGGRAGAGAAARRVWASVPAVVLALSSVGSAAVVTTPCGLTATVHDAAEIVERWLAWEDGRLWLRHPAAGGVELLLGPDDPRLPRDDVETFVPLTAAPVAQALQSLTGIQPELDVEVFLLPAPPAVALGSFASRNCLFLSPGMGPVPDAAIPPLVAHELGHVLEWAYLDVRPERWRAYCALRELDEASLDATTPHAERAREILAEDVRVLFGGEEACGEGELENTTLAPPDEVQGLRDSLAGWLSGQPPAPDTAVARAFPLPARGQVRMEWVLDADTVAKRDVEGGGAGSAVFEIFDLRGRLVRRVAAADLQGGRLLAHWDGRDADGRPVAAGRYAFVARLDVARARGSLLIVR